MHYICAKCYFVYNLTWRIIVSWLLFPTPFSHWPKTHCERREHQRVDNKQAFISTPTGPTAEWMRSAGAKRTQRRHRQRTNSADCGSCKISLFTTAAAASENYCSQCRCVRKVYAARAVVLFGAFAGNIKVYCFFIVMARRAHCSPLSCGCDSCEREKESGVSTVSRRSRRQCAHP